MPTTPTPPPPPKPLPRVQPESAYYWEKCREHELWLRRCGDCETAYFYPRPICPHCFSRNTEWVRSSGRGTVYAFAIVHRAPPAFRPEAPYVAAIVELEEGPRMPTNLVEVEPDTAHVRCGMAVEVLFREASSEISLPVFRPAS